MRKWSRVFISVLLLASIFCSSGVWAIGKPKAGSEDPYAAFHREIEAKIKGIYYKYSSEKASIRAKMGGNIRSRGVITDDMQQDMVLLDQEIQAIQQDYKDEMRQMLESYGAVYIDNQGTVELRYNPGNVQTHSDDAAYFQNTKEFCYIIAFECVPPILDDMWGDYDLISMEMKNNNGWSWNNISTTVWVNDLADTGSGMTCLGDADKYHVISGNYASARSDFWNGCIFNVKDKNGQLFAVRVGLSDILMVGWLQTRGNSRSNQVKADFEHNYKKNVFNFFSITGASIKDFNLQVSYSAEINRWSRTTGSRWVEIPAGY